MNINNLVSIFSRAARLVDENGSAVILKNNTPRYVIMEFSQFQKEEQATTEDVDLIARRLLKKHQAAFEKLAK